MPTYDYECTSCGHLFEAFQSMSEAPLKDCPVCGKEVRRLIGAGLGIIFKGSGFYSTDNRGSNGNGKKREENKGESSSSENNAKEGGKSDSSSGSSSDSSSEKKSSTSKKTKETSKT